MVKIIINLLLLVLLARLAAARPQQDLVHLPVANYSHPWYSGTLPSTQAISTSPPATTITSSLTRSETPITIL